ncbi:glycosyltransferase [Microbacterium awajiense]|uniref:Glycosyltransferase n=1 Tax=Microbacterium awajiense TaxID=415214 RepID=A0ABP7AIZ8_9MICO
MSARLSIVVPAHNEGPLVRRSLTGMLRDAEPGEFEVIVVANGCDDDTAAQAGGVPGVIVTEIAEASKIAALNRGDELATVYPRAYVDADVDIDTAALRRLAALLMRAEHPVVAAPTLRVDAAASTPAVRAHTRVWELSEYRQAGHVGSGVYAVNELGRMRWGRFPPVIADDRFVQLRFAAEERVTDPDATFTVRAPRDMTALVRRGIRIERGNRELDAEAGPGGGGSRRALVARVARSPRLWASFPFYVYGYAAPKIRVRMGSPRGPVSWGRDESAREAARV